MAEEKTEKQHRFTEQIEIAGQDLVERVKEILAEGNVRQLRIKAADGDVFFETPLTIGVIAGGAVALAAPWLAILAVIAALVTRVQIEVMREDENEAAAETTDEPAEKSTARLPKPGKTAA